MQYLCGALPWLRELAGWPAQSIGDLDQLARGYVRSGVIARTPMASY
jgi:hypothetical protein